LQHTATHCNIHTATHFGVRGDNGVLQCVAVCCSVLQCVAVCCTLESAAGRVQCACMLQCVVVCCNVLHFIALCCRVLCFATAAMTAPVRHVSREIIIHVTSTSV